MQYISLFFSSRQRDNFGLLMITLSLIYMSSGLLSDGKLSHVRIVMNIVSEKLQFVTFRTLLLSKESPIHLFLNEKMNHLLFLPIHFFSSIKIKS